MVYIFLFFFYVQINITYFIYIKNIYFYKCPLSLVAECFFLSHINTCVLIFAQIYSLYTCVHKQKHTYICTHTDTHVPEETVLT